MMERVGASTCWTKVAARELVDALGNLVNLVDALDEGGDEGVDVDVADALAALLHRGRGRLLHLVAHVHITSRARG